MKRIAIILCLLFGISTITIAQSSVRDIAQSVVLIGIVENGEFVGNGSGTIVTSTGLIYTNRHVVEDAEDLGIFILEDIQELPVLRYFATPVQVFEDIDFAIIQIDRDENGRSLDANTLNLPALPPASSPIDIGDEVTIYGYPAIGDGYMVVTSGRIVTIQNGWINGERMPVWYRTDSEFSGGNSGGLVVNASGEFVGLPTWVVSEDRTAGKLGGVLPVVTVNAVMIDSTSVVDNNEPALVDQPDRVFLLENQSTDVICYVFISPSSATEWGIDQLGNGESIQQDGSRSWQVTPNFYDVLLRDCDGNNLDDIRNVDMTGDGYTLTYTGTGESIRVLEDESSNVPTGSVTLSNLPDTSVHVTCEDGSSFDNGFELVIGQVELGREYIFTAIGINGFDPVIAVVNNDTGEGVCVNNDPTAATFRANLPTTGEVPSTTSSAQAIYSQNSGQPPDTISIVVGSPVSSGDFILIAEGQSVSGNDGGGDIISLRLSPSIVARGIPLTTYMMSTQTQLDSYMFLLTPGTTEPFVTPDGEAVICDDAGKQTCWGENADLSPYSVSISGGLRLNGGELDTMISIPMDGLSVAGVSEPLYFNMLMSSFQQQTQGDYVIVIHTGLQ